MQCAPVTPSWPDRDARNRLSNAPRGRSCRGRAAGSSNCAPAGCAVVSLATALSAAAARGRRPSLRGDRFDVAGEELIAAIERLHAQTLIAPMGAIISLV